MNIVDFFSQTNIWTNIGIGALAGLVIAFVIMQFVIGYKNIGGMSKSTYKHLRWFLKEFLKMYSAHDSFFSKKRIESGIAFIVAECGAIFWLERKYDVMTTSEFIMWLGPQLVIAGWMVQKIENGKRII